MAGWFRNPKRPDSAVNLDRLSFLAVHAVPEGWSVVGSEGLVAGPFESEGAARAVLTEIVGAVD